MDLVSNLKDIAGEIKEKDFLEQDINLKAKEDFKFLCSQTGYVVYNNIHYLKVKTNEYPGRDCGDFLVVGHDVGKSKKVVFPRDLLACLSPNVYVAVAAYESGRIRDVYLFQAAEFKKTGMFSIFKYDKNDDAYEIHLPGEGKLEKYSFGYVLKNI